MTQAISTDKTVLITGASGFVGQRLASRLSAAGVPVHLAYGPRHENGIDLESVDAVNDMMRHVSPDVIVHLAAISSIGEAIAVPRAVWANVRITDSLVSSLRGYSKKVRFIFASTAEVYGSSFDLGPVDEEASLDPRNAYARSKVACEYLLRDAASERFEVVSLRLFNHSGPGQSRRFVLPSFAAQIAAIEAGKVRGPVLHGNLDTLRDFADIEDVLDAYSAVISHREAQAGFSVFNVGTGRPVALRSILDTYIQLARTPIATKLDPSRVRENEVSVAAGKVERFFAEYGIRLGRSLRQLLSKILDNERRRAKEEE
jgi:GDP-4-dehydro-6-deoxy-D-mannose reductase